MFEIGKDVTSPAEFCDSLSSVSKTLGRIVVLPQAQIEKVSSLDRWRLYLFTFSVAQCGIFPAKRGEHLFGKPRFVTKFEGRAQVKWQSGKKFCQQRNVAFQKWRQLKQNRPEPASLLQRLEGRGKFRHQLGRSTKPLDMRDALVCLDGEFESCGRRIQPFNNLSVGKLRNV
jgi:hypothetical protein